LHGFAFACFFAYTATDAAHRTIEPYVFAPVTRVATYAETLMVRDHFDQLLRAGLYAYGTARAFIVVYDGNPVLDADRVKQTNLYTTPAAQASVGAAFGTAPHQTDGGTAILNALVSEKEKAVFIGAQTFDISGFPCGQGGVNAQDVGYLIIQLRTPHGAAVGFGSPREHFLGKGIASGMSAPAAINPG